MFENQLLERVAKSAPELLQGRLKSFEFANGDVLAEPDAPIQRMVFPCSGLISIVVELNEGDQIETGMVGCRGALGGCAIFGAGCHLTRAVAQISGRGWSMRIEDAKELAGTSPEFRDLVFAQEQYLLAQSTQFAACNAKHVIVQRLCSWLLRVQDEIGGGELLMTQENLAKMLGVQRASVSMLASQLQQQGVISYRRGRLHISDPEALKARACECGETLNAQYAQLFAEDIDGSAQSAAGNIRLGGETGKIPAGDI